MNLADGLALSEFLSTFTGAARGNASPNPLRLRRSLEHLVEADVRFVLVGGLAVNAWGYVRGTDDVDVVPYSGSENLESLNALLGGLEDSQIHALQGLPQVPRFEVLSEQATEVEMDGLVVRVCSLEHLLEMKRESGRPRDRDDLEALEAARDDLT